MTLIYDTNAVLDCRHQSLINNIKEWENIKKSLAGGIDWIEHSLKRFDCESIANFELRKLQAINKIPVSTPIQALINLARGSKTQMRIKGASDRVDKICNNDFDNNGNSWTTFAMEKVLKNVIAYGKYFIFASSPQTLSLITLADEIIFNPLALGSNPLQVVNYRYTNGDTKINGQFEDILFLTTEIVLDTTTKYDVEVDIAVRMTREEITVIAVDDCTAYNINGLPNDYSRGDIIRTVPNSIGLVPVRCVDIDGSLVKELVNLSSQAMNIQSGAYLGTLDSNYNQKWVAGGELPDEFTSGASTVIQFSDPATKFEITENPAGTIENSIKFNDDLQTTLDTIMQNQYQNLAKKGGNAPSGEALTQMASSQAQAVGYLMDSIADALTDVVTWLHALTGESIKEDIAVVMPETYESTTKQDAVALSLDAQDISAMSKDGLRIKLIEKWQPITPPADLDDVVNAELVAEWAILQATQNIDAAKGDFG